MSDNLLETNRRRMIERFGIRVGTGVEIMCRNSFLSAIHQSLFACEEFRIKIILTGHQYQNLYLHKFICHLFKHMVIGKEMFVIPQGIIELVSTNFGNPFKEQTPHLVLEALLQSITNSYQFLLQNQQIQNPYPNPNECFASRFLFMCTTEQCAQFNRVFLVDNIYTNVFNINEQFRSVQQELDNYVNQNYWSMKMYKKFNKCIHCKQQSTQVIEWRKPRVLIIALYESPHSYDIEDIVTIHNEQYSLFASICKVRNERVYCCYAKHAGIWYYFKGRFVHEMPSLTQLTEVNLLFYKKVVYIDYSNFRHHIDTAGVIPPLVFNFDVTKGSVLFDNNVITYRSMTTTNLDLIADQNDFLAHQQFGNLWGYCYMNSVLQALYHCRIFRKYILNCNEKAGYFHRYLKKLFTAIKLNDRELVKTSHMEFYSVHTHTPIFRKNNNFSTYLQIIAELDQEMNVILGRNDIFRLQPRNYAEIMIGREDMSSNDAWMRFMIQKNNGSLCNMFTVQQMYCERCRYGHKNFLRFNHNVWVDIAERLWLSTNPVFNSLQDIIDYYKGSVPAVFPPPGRFCKSCPQNNPINRLYWYSAASVTRACDILVFKFQVFAVDPHFPQNKALYRLCKTTLTINEQLIVCGHTYQCTAFVLFNDMRPLPHHAYTFALCDNKRWCLLEDNSTIDYGTAIPRVEDLYDNQTIDMVFYEKIKFYANIESMSTDHENDENDENDENGSNKPLIDLKNIGIKAKQLYLRPNTKPNPLTTQASKLGITNPNGHTSYMNAVIQCLYHCSQFRNYIILDPNNTDNDSKPIHMLLKWFFVNLSVTNHHSMDQTTFWNIFVRLYHREFAGNREYDPKLFLNAIFRDLAKEFDDSVEEYGYLEESGLLDDVLNSYRNKANLNIIDMFGLIYSNKIYCKADPLHRRFSYKTEYIIELEITNRSLKLRIQTLIDAYLMKLNLRDTKKLCKVCGYNALNMMSISRFPNILVIQLKILSFDESVWRVIKLESDVEFNPNIEIYGEVYSFRSYICCDGHTDQPFHYSSYIKCNDGFYHFDDITVRNIPDSHKGRHKVRVWNKVYMLFYENSFSLENN